MISWRRDLHRLLPASVPSLQPVEHVIGRYRCPSLLIFLLVNVCALNMHLELLITELYKRIILLRWADGLTHWDPFSGVILLQPGLKNMV